MSTGNSQSQPIGYDFNGDIPRPDGFVQPTDEEEWKRPSGSNVPAGYGIDGFSGFSEVAARSDHVHPCNISSLNPQLVGLPGFLYTNEYFTQDWDSIQGYGRYGRAGIPLATDTKKSNMYALSNHVHEYGFITSVKHRDGSTASNQLYQASRDGTYLKYGISYSSPNDRGRADLLLDEEPATNPDTQKLGYSGKIPLPAHVDHVHPLNCIELHDSNATGNSVKDNVKPIAFDTSKSMSGYGASYGTSLFYARTDHVHPFPTGGTGASGLTATNKTANVTQEYVKSDSNWVTTRFSSTGNDYEWSCDDVKNTNGVVIPVCVDCRYVNGRNVAVFRRFHFSKHGLLKFISRESYAYNLSNSGWGSNIPSV